MGREERTGDEEAAESTALGDERGERREEREEGGRDAGRVREEGEEREGREDIIGSTWPAEAVE